MGCSASGRRRRRRRRRIIIIIIITWYTVLFSYTFISVLYMFWATLCSSSGESIVSIQHLVCRSGSSFLTCILDGHLHRVSYTRHCIDTICSSDDEHEVAWNM
jgi:hypothetical protein